MSKQPKRPITGWLILDKPAGMSSAQAVGKVRWLYNAMKAGHAGTLDPLATGILPIALGEATKTVPFIQDGHKRYRFTLVWGSATNTDDTEGEIVATSDVRPSAEDITAALPRFTGDILQRPPAYSAIKIDGERAYARARAGEAVEMAARPVHVETLTLIDHGAERSTFDMQCGAGTYVRAIARDLAEALGSRGHVGTLRRLAVGDFGEAGAVTLETLEAATDREALLLPASAALRRIPEIRLTPDEAALIRNGNPVLLRGRDAPVSLPEAWASLEGNVLALGSVVSGQFRPGRVLN
ncbi:MAG TPA: tRNA pseudouridine(55) synthase TruB [Devosia sp.]|nr:tRNA pseudouridine(55) synthase TruB [Devosia sp.]